jgi:hypothetical protein
MTPDPLQAKATYRVKETFYPSNVLLRAGTIVRIDWFRERIDSEARLYEVSVGVTPIEPAGGTIIWVRSYPLDKEYVERIFERVAPPTVLSEPDVP